MEKKTNELPIETTIVEVDTRKFHVIRDDNIPGGTKIRGALSFMENNPEIEEFIYAGPSTGFAQVALALSCQKFGKRATIFLCGRKNRITRFLSSMDHVKLIFPYANLKRTQASATIYYYRCREEGKKIMLMPFGFSSPEFCTSLKNNILANLPPSLISNPPKRMWLAAGSGTLLKCLSAIFPNTYFLVVRVGKHIPQECLEPERMRLFISDEYFSSPALQPPPYPTVLTYDAKVWKYVLRHGQNGDYIWNVAKDV
jgi:hypothetical protein